MKILVTGGCGYIGSHTCVKLLEAGHEIVIVDNLSNSSVKVIDRLVELTGKTFEFYEEDILNYDALDVIFEKHNFDGVIHFAGLKAVGESVRIPLNYFHNNITGTIVLLQVMQKHNVKNIVFSSSATVYGDPATVPISEDFPLAVTNPYGRTKLYIEGMLQDLYRADPTMNIALLRYFNPVGAHESGRIGEAPDGIPNNLTPYITQVAIGKLPYLNVYGNDYPTHDGTGVRDYIHVVDLAEGHLLAIDKLAENCGLKIYNLGTGVGYSVLDVLHAFEKAVGKEIPFKFAPRRAGDIAECYADPSLAAKELGFSCKFGLDRMCADSWNWQKNNPKGYDD